MTELPLECPEGMRAAALVDRGHETCRCTAVNTVNEGEQEQR